MSDNKKLFLLDAYALIFRAYYAFLNTRMYSNSGVNTSTTFGFLMALDEVLRVQKPSHISVVFDPSGPNFRHQFYPLYKANRDETPEEIKVSVPLIKKMLEAMNISIIQVDGYEADDVIGTISKKASIEGFEVYMMTPDKDYGQLVQDNVFIYKPKRSGNEAEILGVEDICKKYDIKHPSQVIDILALWGDTSDNVPGVKGIGEKQAIELVSKYGSIEFILERINEIKPAQKSKILENHDMLLLSKKLVTIDLDVPVDLDWEKLKVQPFNDVDLKPLLSELNFRMFLSKWYQTQETTQQKPIQQSLFDQPSIDKPIPEISQSDFNKIKNTSHLYLLCDTIEMVESLIGELENSDAFCFDTETTGLDPFTDKIVGIAFSNKAGKGWYVPLDLDFEKACVLLRKFIPVFQNHSIKKIGHNMKFDMLMLQQYHIEVDGLLFDTMIAHYLIDPEKSHKMDDLAEKYLNYKTVHIEELIGSKGINQKNMSQVSSQLICDYACEDADITYQFVAILEPLLKSKGVWDLFQDIEIPLMQVLLKMETNGVALDASTLNNYAILLRSDIQKIEGEIFELAGNTFNISSPKQLGEILFVKLAIDSNAKQTKTKQFSTSEETLMNYSGKHPIVDKILEYRSLTKLLSTYVETLPKLINPNTGRIHSSFNQTIAATGRLSSTNPNMQNIPIREQSGREIRKSFVPGKSNHVIVSADYSQIELRLMAHLCKDSSMIEAFKNEQDIHALTASKIYNTPIVEVTKEQRRRAKTANFGIIYGISAFGLSQRLNIPRKEANELIEGYFNTFPGVRLYMTESIQKAKELGYAETIMGRRRYLPEINSANAVVRGMAERNAINAPVQGSAADIIKMAMIVIQKQLEINKMKSLMILQVHDELVFEVPLDELDVIKNLVKHEMEHVVNLSVPLTVESGYGPNWLEAH